MYPEGEYDIAYLLERWAAFSEGRDNHFFEVYDFLRIIEHFEASSSFEDAVNVADYALEQYAQSSELYYRVACLFAKMEQPKRALTLVCRAETLGEAGFSLLILKAQLLSSLTQTQEALSVLEMIKTMHLSKTERSDMRLAEGKIHENTQQYVKADMAYKKAILFDLDNEMAFSTFWDYAERRNEQAATITFFEQLTNEYPLNYLTWYYFGQALSAISKFEQAREAFEHSFLLKPSFTLGYELAADACICLANYKLAIRYCEEWVENIGDSAEAFLKIGFCHQKQENITNAKKFYIKSIDILPDLAPTHYHLGKCYLSERNLLAALGCFKKACQIEPKNEFYELAYGEVQLDLGNLEAAEDAFENVRKLASDIAEVWIHLASIYVSIGEYEKAIDTIEDAKKYTESTDFDYFESAVYFALGRRQEAKRLLLLALKAQPDGYHLLFELVPTLQKDYEVLQMIADSKAFMR